MTRRQQRGATTIEMALVGIPIIFILISVFEVSRGMWMYQTISYATRNAVRFASVHGINCTPAIGTFNNCPTTIATITGRLQFSGVGLDPAQTLLKFTPGVASATPTQCYMGSSSAQPVAGQYGSFIGCLSIASTWPPDDGTGTFNGVGKSLRIDAKVPFRSAISMFWPGSRPMQFGAANLGASSVDYVQF